MPNDRTASELITKSLHGKLSDAESELLDEQCSGEIRTKAFAELSRAIHDSVAEQANSVGDLAEQGPGLSDAAKERMRSSIRAASQPSGVEATVDLSSTVRDPASADQVQRQSISRFTMLRKIAEGGLGTVWLARDERIKRTVALKEMNARALQSPKAWARFLREAQITAHLEHPSVVPMYLFGEDADTGQLFYAMRFVGKRTLADAIFEYHEKRLAGDAAEMDLHRLLVAFQSVCQAIAYVHSKGVIHRDLKPENVALDAFGQVIVLDWGLAKFLDDGELRGKFNLSTDLDADAMDQTQDGEIVGTPAFMAPEQAAGELDDLNERTDVYGLGAILFAILTGDAPHGLNKTNSEQNSAGKLLQRIIHGESPQPRERNPNVPRELAQICSRAMAKRSHSRFDSASVLAEKVEMWLAGQREKPRQYEAVRMEGRELRANLEAAIEDLAKNVRFMANLPPVQGLIQSAEQDREEKLVWRDRLNKIFEGLLRTNSDYMAVGYCHVNESSNKAIEIVRVERHSSDSASIRSIPISRLETREVSPFVAAVVNEKPEEVRVAHEIPENCANCTGRLAAGVPVFDERTEEPFGYVTIELDLSRLIDEQIRRRVRETKQLYLLDEQLQLRHHHSTVGQVRDCDSALSELPPEFQSVLASLDCEGEFIDDYDHRIYASRIDLPGGHHSLKLILLAE